MNISTSQKNKTKIEIYKVLQLLFTMFHILKSLHNIFIINPTSYNSFNVQNQTIVHPPFDSFISNLLRYLNELLLFFFFFFFFKFKINKFLLLLLSSFFSPYFKSNWFVIGGVFFYLFNILFRGLRWAGLLPAVLLLYWAGLLPVVLGPSVLSKGVETGPTRTQIGPTYAQTMPHLPGTCLRQTELF